MENRSDPEMIASIPLLFSQLLDYIQPISILGTALEGAYVLCKELLFSQMNRISILQLQVSMTIKTKHSSAPTWYLMANAAAAYNSSIFIPLLAAEQRHYISPKQLDYFYSDFPPPQTQNCTTKCVTLPPTFKSSLPKLMPNTMEVTEFYLKHICLVSSKSLLADLTITAVEEHRVFKLS